MTRTPDDLDRLRRMLDDARRIVFFTGAGISTESGIPDYRSPGTGLWTKMQPIQFQDFIASDRIRRESWRRRFSGDRPIENAKPNKGHEAIAKLIHDGKASVVITQNVDNLHQNSGIDPSRVIELHGNATYAKCLDCGRRYELVHLERQFVETGGVAPCAECHGIIKSATISFGQSMPQTEMRRAQEQTVRCDLFVVVGSSLVVYPAAGFPELAKELGAKLAIVNREPTPLDRIADLVVRREIGPTLSFAVGIN
jgi:NAD-dependent deacetylase